MSAVTILLIIALICWFLAAISTFLPANNPVQLGWLGLFFWGLSQLIR